VVVLPRSRAGRLLRTADADLVGAQGARLAGGVSRPSASRSLKRNSFPLWRCRTNDATANRGFCATVGLVCAAGVMASAASPTPGRTVPCRESIDGTKFPYVGSSRPRDRYRLVLGTVSVPPAYLAQVVSTGETPWAYWRKAGLVVRAGGQAVSISVPLAWRERAAITWGNGGNGVFDSPHCGLPRRPSSRTCLRGRLLSPLAVSLSAACLPRREAKRDHPLRYRPPLLSPLGLAQHPDLEHAFAVVLDAICSGLVARAHDLTKLGADIVKSTSSSAATPGASPAATSRV
jgi:hypothetical protein